MKLQKRKYFFIVALFAYTAAAIFGHLPVFSSLLNGTTTEKTFAPEKKSRAPSSIPLWTQKKHTPVTYKYDSLGDVERGSVFSLQNLRATEVLHEQQFFFFSFFQRSCQTPRAPPLSI